MTLYSFVTAMMHTDSNPKVDLNYVYVDDKVIRSKKIADFVPLNRCFITASSDFGKKTIHSVSYGKSDEGREYLTINLEWEDGLEDYNEYKREEL